MHFITLSVNTLALGAVLFRGGVMANSGFASTCNSIRLEPPENAGQSYSLFANCRMPNGVYSTNDVLQLNACLGNSGGTLVAQSNGGFTPSCPSASLSGTVITATCGDGRGGSKRTSVDLNNIVGNQNGQMYCFNHT